MLQLLWHGRCQRIQLYCNMISCSVRCLCQRPVHPAAQVVPAAAAAATKDRPGGRKTLQTGLWSGAGFVFALGLAVSGGCIQGLGVGVLPRSQNIETFVPPLTMSCRAHWVNPAADDAPFYCKLSCSAGSCK